ncbi:uncharacterized protein J3R85_002902 [Psidium guajava]|nr:uncharacterized protein J3R85_002902 [Psidium guajava]
MNRRTRRINRRSEPYLKYLKPGALAQLRDSRISARLHRVDSLIQICPSPPPNQDGQPPVDAAGGMPCFVGRFYGPRCPQRKKLVAAKCVWFVGSSPGSPAPNESDPAVDFFGGDGVTAH